MIEVELPDGSVAEFPDGTPPEAMKKAIQKRFPVKAPESAVEADFRQFGSNAIQNLGEAVDTEKTRTAQEEYDNLDWWQKPIVAADDVMRLATNGATMGFGDKAFAGARSLITGGNYDEELAKQRALADQARRRAGSAGTAAEITGAVATSMKLAGSGATLAGRFGTGAMTGAKGLAARTALMGVEGAGYGALSAKGNDTDVGTGALFGAGAGAAGNLIGEGVSAAVGKIAGKFNPKTPVPTVDDLEAAGRASYKQAEQAGAIFNNKGVKTLQRNVVDDLKKVAFDPANEPGVMPVLQRLRALGNGNITLEGLDSLRRVASNGWRPGMKSNNAAIAKIIDRIDELVQAADPTMMAAAGNPKDAANAILKARSNWHRARKLETVEKAITRGEQNAAAQVSGDVGRTTMGQLKKIMQSEAKSRGFTPAEMKALGSAAGYSTGQRVAHAVGGLMPRGRLLSSIHAATALGTGGMSLPLQATGAAVGYAAQKTAEAISKRSVGELVKLIANGGVPPQVMQNAIQRLASSKREALSRALMAIAVHQSAGRKAPANQQQP